MSRGGFILLEASLTTIVLSLALVALVPLFILSIRANKNMERIKVASQLSVEILEEVRLRRWDEKTPLTRKAIFARSAISLDQGESGSDKRTFDDIDDFNGWTESAVLDPVMRPLAEFSGYSRSATVAYVNADMTPASAPTAYKQVTVCTQTPKMTPVCLNSLFTDR